MRDQQSSVPPSLHFSEDTLRRTVSSRPVRVLIAEDDSSIRLMLETALKSEDYDIVSVSDGEAAWAALQDSDDPPRLAILDWMMPRINGLELCHRIKARREPLVFTILLTAKTDNSDIHAGLEAGADEFLTKPFNINVLRSRVATGARIVRLENLIAIKNAILADYIQKVEKLVDERARLLSGQRTPSS